MLLLLGIFVPVYLRLLYDNQLYYKEKGVQADFKLLLRSET